MALEAPRYDVTLYAGATFAFIAVVEQSDTAVDLTGYTAVLKGRPTQDSSSVIFSWTTNDYITISASAGQIAVEVPPDVTMTCIGYAGRDIVYEMALLDDSDHESVLMRGQMHIKKRVSR